MKKTKAFISFLLIISLAVGFLPAQAAQSVPVRTVMMYCCGSDLESYEGYATENLIQAMESEYNENLNFIVITGGADRWQMSSKYLNGAPKIDPKYNQIWKLEGRKDSEEYGKMTLLESKGLSGFSGAYMSDHALLKAFIDYCYDNYPADIYDLILWDHGGGPVYGFSYDERTYDTISLSETVEALSATKLYKNGRKFDFIDFDVCLMCSVEILEALSGFTDVLIASPEEEPGGGQYYTGWLDAVKADPAIGAFEIGRIITDDFIQLYEEYGDGYPTIMTVVDIVNFNSRVLPYLDTLSGLLIQQALTTDEIDGLLSVYDEIYSIRAVIEYGSYDYDLFDIGQLAGVLSCPQTELDTANADMIDEVRNVYTECALAILEALRDCDNSGDDVLYTGYIDVCGKRVPGLQARDLDGSVVLLDGEGLGVISGISLFFPTASVANTEDYVDEMSVLSELMPEGAERSFIEKHTKTSAFYGVLIPILSAAAQKTASGKQNVSFSSIKAELKNSGKWNLNYAGIIDYLVENEVFSSAAEAESRLEEATDSQVAVSLYPAKADLIQVKNADGAAGSCRLTLSGTSSHIVAGAFSGIRITAVPSSLDMKMLISLRGYSYIKISEYFKNGLIIDESLNKDEREYGKYVTEYSDSDTDLKKRMFADTDYITYVKKTECSMMTLRGDDGMEQLAWICYTNEEQTEGYIPMIFLEKHMNETDYYLYLALDNGEWIVKGLSENIAPEAERIYVSADSIYVENSAITYAPSAYMTDSVYYVTSLIPTADFIELKSSADFSAITASAVTEEDLAGGAVNAGYCFIVSDIFGNAADLTEEAAAAEAAAEEGVYITNINGAEISAAEPDPGDAEQRPVITVKIGDTALVEGVDYRILYGESDAQGEARIMIIGVGDYCGVMTGTYNVTPSAVIIGDVNGDGKVDGRDLIRIRIYLNELGSDPSAVSTVIFPGADLNGDNVINGLDLIRLRKMLNAA